MKKSYCTQNNGDCSACSLSSYNKDCQNNPIVARDEYIHARIPADLKAQAQAYAAETGRTLTGLVEWLLRQELKKNGVAYGQKGWKNMKKWIVLIELHNGATEEFETFDKMEDASTYAEKYWNHLSAHDKKRSKITVGYGKVDDDGKGFAYDENGDCITDMYDTDAEGNRLEKTEYLL